MLYGAIYTFLLVCNLSLFNVHLGWWALTTILSIPAFVILFANMIEKE